MRKAKEDKMNICEAMEKARRIPGIDVDRIYNKLDAGTLDPESTLEEMVNVGIPRKVAAVIVEEATGLVFEGERK
jgi:hypothetical protein